jgi:RNA polymerase sigma factor (TIGR02999 family)
LSRPEDVTALLQAWGEGDADAGERLMPLVYAELRRRAAQQLRGERRAHTLEPTALVNEAFVRLVDQKAAWQNRGHFYAVASRMMRRVLVDHARARQRIKRDAGLRLSLSDVDAARPAVQAEVEVLALNEALDELAAREPRQARLVELRYFGGLSESEAASALSVSRATASREWSLARAWLYRRIRKGTAGLLA